MARPYNLYVVTARDGRKYVGMTITPVETRWMGHQSNAYGCYGYQCTPYSLGAAIQRHGPDYFSVEHVASATDAKSARTCERLLILQNHALAPSGFNLRLGKADREVPEVKRDWIVIGNACRGPRRRAA